MFCFTNRWLITLFPVIGQLLLLVCSVNCSFVLFSYLFFFWSFISLLFFTVLFITVFQSSVDCSSLECFLNTLWMLLINFNNVTFIILVAMPCWVRFLKYCVSHCYCNVQQTDFVEMSWSFLSFFNVLLITFKNVQTIFYTFVLYYVLYFCTLFGMLSFFLGGWKCSLSFC